MRISHFACYNHIKSMKKTIEKLLKEALSGADVEIVVPKESVHGDYSTSISLALAKKEGRNPREIANDIKEKIEKLDNGKLLKKVEIAGPGHINFFIKITLRK